MPAQDKTWESLESIVRKLADRLGNAQAPTGFFHISSESDQAAEEWVRRFFREKDIPPAPTVAKVRHALVIRFRFALAVIRLCRAGGQQLDPAQAKGFLAGLLSPQWNEHFRQLWHTGPGSFVVAPSTAEGVPHAEMVQRAMEQNALKAATKVEPESEEWLGLALDLAKDGYIGGTTALGFAAALDVMLGRLDAWRLEDGTYHFSERGFVPGEYSRS